MKYNLLFRSLLISALALLSLSAPAQTDLGLEDRAY